MKLRKSQEGVKNQEKSLDKSTLIDIMECIENADVSLISHFVSTTKERFLNKK